LQSHDKLEGVLLQTLSAYYKYGEILYPQIKHHEDWLLQRAKGTKITPVEGGPHNAVTLGFLAKLWLEELSIRRCVWCWNKHTGLSHALGRFMGSVG
jgi:hypothetical protein